LYKSIERPEIERPEYGCSKDGLAAIPKIPIEKLENTNDKK